MPQSHGVRVARSVATERRRKTRHWNKCLKRYDVVCSGTYVPTKKKPISSGRYQEFCFCTSEQTAASNFKNYVLCTEVSGKPYVSVTKVVVVSFLQISQMKHQLDATLCRFYFCRVTLHVSHHISLLGPSGPNKEM